MSHRKFERPRSGNLGFAPKKRCGHAKGKIHCFPEDETTAAPHFTAFMGYKAGMTHVLRDCERPGSRLNKKEVVDCVTIVETPPMVVVGMVGYKNTARGLKPVGTVWAKYIGEGVRRRFCKNFTASKDKNFSKNARKDYSPVIEDITTHCDIVRAIVATQPEKISTLHQKKAHVCEVQVNGGSTEDKVTFITNLFEQEVPISTVFTEGENTDIISISKGHGTTGVITRWGVNRLQRKTHRGLRKVACIGAWHPARCEWTVPRAGQMGYHQRTQTNSRIFRLGSKDDPRSGCTDADITEKKITPMGGFPNYGIVNHDFLMLKGTIIGVAKRVVTIRKPLMASTSRKTQEPANIKFIDTSSKVGRGRFQTSIEKGQFFGPLKKTRLAAAAQN
eukprot:GHVH01000885.1.p1 GENE.GHVH01000885.1~~GHVH01000885.1.p1  ORF type:complete len:390 (+),score=69.58 GHVH01000885.1:80-1249(+)